LASAKIAKEKKRGAPSAKDKGRRLKVKTASIKIEAAIILCFHFRPKVAQENKNKKRTGKR